MDAELVEKLELRLRYSNADAVEPTLWSIDDKGWARKLGDVEQSFVDAIFEAIKGRPLNFKVVDPAQAIYDRVSIAHNRMDGLESRLGRIESNFDECAFDGCSTWRFAHMPAKRGGHKFTEPFIKGKQE